MNSYSASQIGTKSDYFFTFSYTLKNESVEIGGDGVYLFPNGFFYSNQSIDSQDQITIIVVGGIDKFLFAKNSIPAVPFYMTELQKRSIYTVVKKAARERVVANFRSDNEELQTFITALARNTRR